MIRDHTHHEPLCGDGGVTFEERRNPVKHRIAPIALGVSPMPKPKTKRIDIPSITAAIEMRDSNAMRAWRAVLLDLISKLEGQLAADSAALIADRIDLTAEGHAPDEAQRLAELGSDPDWRGRVLGLMSIAKAQLSRIEVEIDRPAVRQYAQDTVRQLAHDKAEKEWLADRAEKEKEAVERRRVEKEKEAVERRKESQLRQEEKVAQDQAAKAKRMAENAITNRQRVRVIHGGRSAEDVAATLEAMIAQGCYVVSIVVVGGDVIALYRGGENAERMAPDDVAPR